MRADNSHHLVAAAGQRREATLQRTRTALRRLEQTGQPVTFRSVAEAAQVSRSWLYAEEEIRAEIERLRESGRRAHNPAPIPAGQRASPASLTARLEAALERNKTLAEDNRLLREQLAVALGQLRAAKPGGAKS